MIQMARKVKLCGTKPSLILHAVAALILLSGTVECLQCYWCGPLADQVHRSQRAPSCGPHSDHVTDCDPGYTHCAVVASSPPFVESRYCVKFYQDECYTVYCNTTKSYRMTCPCRGELCNGPKTEREIEAFATLAKAVSKTQNTRIKKRHISQPRGLLHSSIVNAMQANEESTNDNIDLDNNVNSNVDNDISERIKVSNLDDVMQSDQPAAENMEIGNSQIKHNDTNSATTGKDEAIIIKTTEASHKNLEMSDTTTAKPEDNNEHLEMTTVPIAKTTMAPIQTTKEVKAILPKYNKPDVELPPAEALQQNSDLMMTSNKPDATSAETMTDMSTFSTMDTSPTPTRINRNSGNTPNNSFSIILLLLMITI